MSTHQPSFIVRAILAACAFVLWGTAARAQICGDANASGSITVADGVAILRAAAGLSSSCTLPVCDVNASGSITVSDGVMVLRAAANLTVNLACAETEVEGFVTGVETTEGTPGTLEVGVAPIPGPGAPATITGEVGGNPVVIAGGSNTLTVPYDVGGAAQMALTEGPALIVAVANSECTPGSFVEGFFRVPLSSTSGEVSVVVVFSQDLGEGSFVICVATISGGVIGQYAGISQQPEVVTSGTVQVSLSFHPAQDADLHLIEPGGEEIYFDNPESQAGGVLDLDSNAGCDIDNVNNENITYPEGVSPPHGEYRVGVHLFASCDGGGVTFTVVVNNGGVQSTFNGSISAEDETVHEVTRFTFPP